MRTGKTNWRELLRCDDLAEANAIATTIAAMEYEVVLRDLATGQPVIDSNPEASEERGGGPWAVESRTEDWGALTDVMDQIVDEQDEFSDLIALREQRVHRARRVFLLLLVVVAALIAMVVLGTA